MVEVVEITDLVDLEGILKCHGVCHHGACHGECLGVCLNVDSEECHNGVLR